MLVLSKLNVGAARALVTYLNVSWLVSYLSTWWFLVTDKLAITNAIIVKLLRKLSLANWTAINHGKNQQTWIHLGTTKLTLDSFSCQSGHLLHMDGDNDINIVLIFYIVGFKQLFDVNYVYSVL